MLLPLLTAVYDLRYGPVAYDFVTWLVRARLEQQRRGAQQLHVALVPDPAGLGGFARFWGPHDAAATRWRLWNICVAACPLAGATVTLAPGRDYQPPGEAWAPPGASHFMGPLVEAARRGEKIPLLEPGAAALAWAQRWCAGGRTVVLTLRHNNPDDGRDSDSKAWAAFADWLRGRGWAVITLPDTADVLQGWHGELAAVSLELRAALYASAALACFCHNGPMVLAWHLRAPYLGFGAGIPASAWRAHWQDKLRLAPGEQLPWALPGQRLVYRAATLDVMQEEFLRWEQASAAGTKSCA